MTPTSIAAALNATALGTYEFKLPHAVIENLLHFQKIFSIDPSAAAFNKAIEWILNKNSVV